MFWPFLLAFDPRDSVDINLDLRAGPEELRHNGSDAHHLIFVFGFRKQAGDLRVRIFVRLAGQFDQPRRGKLLAE